MDKPPFRLINNVNPVKISGDSGAKPRYLITHPETKAQFEFGEEELFLITLLDGKRTTSELLNTFNKKFSLSLNEDAFVKFLSQMETYGLFERLEPEEDREEPEAVEVPMAAEPADRKTKPEKEDVEEKAKGKSGRIVLFNPHKLFTFLNDMISPFRFLGWLLLPGIAIAFFIMFNNYSQYIADLETLDMRVGVESHIIKIIIVLFTANLLTKLSQGIVCTHFGGEITQFGIKLLLFLIPRFFIDKGPVKNLARSGQLWTYGMSVIVRMGLFMFGMIIWHLNRGSGTLLASYALFFGLIGLASSIFIANPLWKADGYNWLATYLKMPNLRTNAFIIMRLKLTGRPVPSTLPTSEKNGLLLFGIASLCYTVLFIGGIVYALFLGLEGEYQGAGVALFFLLVGIIFYYFYSTAKTKKEKKEKKGKKSSGKIKQLQKYGAAKFDKKIKGIAPVGQKRIRWLRVLVLGIIGGACFLPYQYEVGGNIVILPSKKLEVHTGMTGEVVKVEVDEGDYVEAGQIIGRLSDVDIKKQIDVTELEIKAKYAELNLLNERAKAEEIALAQEQKKLAEMVLDYSNKEVDRLFPLAKNGFISQKQFDAYVAQAAKDLAGVQIADANIALVKSAPRTSEIKLVEISIQQLQKQLEFLKEELRKTYIRSPMSGVIVTKDLGEHLGRYLPEGGLFTIIQETKTVEAEVYVPEGEIGSVSIDADVSVKVEAYPNRIFKGKVFNVASVAEDDPENAFEEVIRVRMRIENSANTLKSGMTGYGKIKGEQVWAIVAFTKKLVSFVLIEIWSWIP